VDDLRREMIELRQQLEKERTVRMMLEEQVRRRRRRRREGRKEGRKEGVLCLYDL